MPEHKRIDSFSNKAFKKLKSLTQKKYRLKYGLFLVEGVKLVEEAKKTPLFIQSYCSEDREDKESIILSRDLFAHLTEMENSEGLIGLCRIPAEPKSQSKKILYIDGLRDPGNLGTLIRSAEAFGFDIMASLDTVDFFNPKVVRASMGSILRVPCLRARTDVLRELSRKGFQIIGTSPYAQQGLEALKAEHVVLVIGSESHGLQESEKYIEKCVRLNMSGKVESLNAGVFGSLMMFYISQNNL